MSSAVRTSLHQLGSCAGMGCDMTLEEETTVTLFILFYETPSILISR